MQQISINLNFGGAVLPVVKSADGVEVVPLKPICDVIGVDWEGQRRKLQGICAPSELGAGGTCAQSELGAGATCTEDELGADSTYLARRLGACIVLLFWAGQNREMVCIRVDRVAAFLNTLNPLKIRLKGNDSAADFLEAKHQEWDDVIHAYESGVGNLFKERSSRNTSIRTFLSVAREKRNTQDPADRKALSSILGNLAQDLKIPYEQPLTGTE